MSTRATATLRVSLCALILLAVAACGAGGEPAVTDPPAGSAAPSASSVVGELGPGCDLLTDAQLTEIAAFTSERERERDTSEILSSCEWRGAHATGGTGTILVKAWASGGPAQLDEESDRLSNTFGTFAPYTGLGDRGAISHSGGLYVVVGERLLFVEARFGGNADMEIQEALMAALIEAVS